MPINYKAYQNPAAEFTRICRSVGGGSAAERLFTRHNRM